MNKTNPWTTPDRNQSQTPTVVLTLRAILAGVCNRWNEWVQLLKKFNIWNEEKEKMKENLAWWRFFLNWLLKKKRTKWGMLAMFSWSLGGIQTTKPDLASSAVRYEDMKLCTGSVEGGLGWYWVSARGVMVGIYIYIYFHILGPLWYYIL